MVAGLPSLAPGTPGAWANAREPQADVSVAGWGRWDCARGGWRYSYRPRLPRLFPARDILKSVWEFAIPPGILGGYPGEDTPEYPSSLGYPLPWEACGRLGQNYHRGVDLGSLRALK